VGRGQKQPKTAMERSSIKNKNKRKLLFSKVCFKHPEKHIIVSGQPCNSIFKRKSTPPPLSIFLKLPTVYSSMPLAPGLVRSSDSLI
jgi:hypothetical protein